MVQYRVASHGIDVVDNINSPQIGTLPECYNGALLKTTKLTLKENKDFVKAFGLY